MQGQSAGLLTMAMKEILASKPIEAAISISSFQILQDTHVFDLLKPKDKEVLVLEDASGRTNLKGLSKVVCSAISCMFLHVCCISLTVVLCRSLSTHSRSLQICVVVVPTCSNTLLNLWIACNL